MAARSLSAEEQRLWGAVMATVRPLRAAVVPARVTARSALVDGGTPPDRPVAKSLPEAMTPAARVSPSPGRPDKAARPTARGGQPGVRPTGQPANTLDAGWDKRLARGMVAPDASIDLHGHSLASAHALLDAGLQRSIVRGDRVLLLVTGKPPRPESERPHARGAIRAAVADWLAASRHGDAIAAVRGAHPRHGGAGALYIVLRRARTPA